MIYNQHIQTRHCSERWGRSEPFRRGFGGVGGGVWSLLRKLLGSNEHPDWLKIDLNMVETRTAQDYKCSKNSSEWKYTDI